MDAIVFNVDRVIHLATIEKCDLDLEASKNLARTSQVLRLRWSYSHLTFGTILGVQPIITLINAEKAITPPAEQITPAARWP